MPTRRDAIVTQPVLIPGQQLSVNVPWTRDDNPPPAHVRLVAAPKGNTFDERGILEADPISGMNIGGCQVIRRLSPSSDHNLLALRDTLGLGLVPVVMRLLEGDELFQREVSSYSDETERLEHPHLARTYPCEPVRAGVYWVTELVSGATLAEISDACVKAGKSVPVGIALAAVHEASLALAALHGPPHCEAHGLLCDRSLVVGFDGAARVLDVGLFRAMRRQGEFSEVLDRIGPYLAPEQILRGHMADARSDVFALAALLHAFLSGGRTPAQLPFGQRALMHQKGGYPPPSSLNVALSARLDEVVLKALSADPMHRFATAMDFAHALKGAASELFWRPELRAQFVGQLFAERKRREEVLFAATSNERGDAMPRPNYPRHLTPPWAQNAPRVSTPPVPQKQVKTSRVKREQYVLGEPTPDIPTNQQRTVAWPVAQMEEDDEIPFADDDVEEVWEDDGDEYDDEGYPKSRLRPLVLALIAASLGWFWVQNVPLEEVPKWAPAYARGNAAALERWVRPHIFPVKFWSPEPIFEVRGPRSEVRVAEVATPAVSSIAKVEPVAARVDEVVSSAPLAAWEPVFFGVDGPKPPLFEGARHDARAKVTSTKAIKKKHPSSREVKARRGHR